MTLFGLVDIELVSGARILKLLVVWLIFDITLTKQPNNKHVNDVRVRDKCHHTLCRKISNKTSYVYYDY